MDELLNKDIRDCIKATILEYEDLNEIACNVETGDEIDTRERRRLATVFRRKIKPEDIVLVSYEERYEAGFCMTKDGIFCWGEDDTVLDIFFYKDITGVDYDEESVIIYEKEKMPQELGKEITKSILGGTLFNKTSKKYFSPGEDCDLESIRAFYNLLYDIVEIVNSSSDATVS